MSSICVECLPSQREKKLPSEFIEAEPKSDEPVIEDPAHATIH